MKEKVKKFVEENKAIVIGAGVGVAALTSGIICYRLGSKSMFESIRKRFANDHFMKTMITAVGDSKNYYVRTLGPDEIMKFKELGSLAKEAIEYGESQTHLNDNIVGMFVLTNPET